jgi:hypothetical protein
MASPLILPDSYAMNIGRYGQRPMDSGVGDPMAMPGKRERKVQSLVDIRPKSYVDSSITALFMGRRGRGKTLAMSTLALIMQRRFMRYRTGGRIMTNYWLDFLRRDSDNKPIDLYSPILIDEAIEYPSWLRNAYMVLDEIQTAATGRRSMSRTNVGLSAFATQIRHRNVEMAFTTQFPQVLDYQLLLQVDLFISVDVATRDEWGIPTALTFYIHDYWGQWTGLNHRKRWPPPDDEADRVRMLTGVRRLIGHYSTKQIIAPTFSPFRDRLIDDEDELLGRPGDWDEATSAVEHAQEAIKDNPGAAYVGLPDLLARAVPAGDGVNIHSLVDRAMAADASIATVGGLRTRMREMGFTFEGFIAKRGEDIGK